MDMKFSVKVKSVCDDFSLIITKENVILASVSLDKFYISIPRKSWDLIYKQVFSYFNSKGYGSFDLDSFSLQKFDRFLEKSVGMSLAILFIALEYTDDYSDIRAAFLNWSLMSMEEHWLLFSKAFASYFALENYDDCRSRGWFGALKIALCESYREEFSDDFAYRDVLEEV